MSATDARFNKAQEIGFDLDEAMPVRIWVEGDNSIYGDFQSNTGQRVRLTPLDVIRLVHKARLAASALISI